MAKKKAVRKTATKARSAPAAKPEKDGMEPKVLRQPAEITYGDQLEALRQEEQGRSPSSWQLSPRSVLRYVLGGDPVTAKIGAKKVEVPITRKFFGDDALVERAIVTLASERALLLVGEPGTGKSWLSEHLAAAISGNSTLTIQGTAGTTEDQIKYSWNIARVIAEGPNPGNMIPSPTMTAMRAGALLRFEEITRCVPDIQDSLVSILSEKNIAVPELPDANSVYAAAGFNVIATANSRDQGVNELSAALKRRFNYIHIPIVSDQDTEIKIVQQRSSELLARFDLPVTLDRSVLEILTTVFREIRDGRSAEGVKVKIPSTTISTAEAIGVAIDSALHSAYFGDDQVGPDSIARQLVGSVVKEDLGDLAILKEYVTVVAKRRAATDKRWALFFEAAQQELK